MRLLICGDRHWTDYALVKNEIEDFDAHIDMVEVIIEGGANGADFCAKLAAFQLDIPVEEFPAHWDELGKRAGPERNKKMLSEGKPDFVLAFHDDFENSKGTKSMIDIAIKANVPHAIIKHDKLWVPTITVHDPPKPKPTVQQGPFPITPIPFTPSVPQRPYNPPYQPYPGTPKPKEPWSKPWSENPWKYGEMPKKRYYYKSGTWNAVKDHPAISMGAVKDGDLRNGRAYFNL